MSRVAAVVALVVALVPALVLAQRPQPSSSPTLTPHGTLRELMKGLVDPTATKLYDAVVVETTEKGTVENGPTTDESWADVAHTAMTLAEAGTLLKVSNRPVVAPEQMDEKSLDASELAPRAIQAMIAKNPLVFAAMADAMSAKAAAVMTLARAKKLAGLAESIEAIDGTCRACHTVFWYPNRK